MDCRINIISQYLLATTMAIGIIACNPSSSLPKEDKTPYTVEIPPHFPPMEFPEDNALTNARVEFGRILFYDPFLSRDSSVSCASCHLQSRAFADNLVLATGIEGKTGLRNVPTLVNIGYSPYFFGEGGSPTLEEQVVGPIENPDEMGFNVRELVERLSGVPFYEEWAQRTYGRTLHMKVISHALASFERTLVSARSPFDKAMAGDRSAMTVEQWRGWELFDSERTQCSSCHPAPLFTDFSLQNIGLYKEYEDQGRYRVSLQEEDKGKFKVPTLRNIALTAPYMHDGSIGNVEEAVDHFDKGGEGHVNQDNRIKVLRLSQQEKQDIIAFLHALTDSHVANEPKWAL